MRVCVQRSNRSRSRADAGSFVTWTVTKPRVQDGGAEVELPASDALAAFDAEVTACSEAAGPTEKLEGSVSLEATALRSAVMRDVVVAEQSNLFVKPNLSACVLETSNTWRLPMARDVRRVRFGWGFATSERRVRSIFVPSERRREIIAAASPEPAEGLDKT